MNQKSSFREVPQFVSQVLTANSAMEEYLARREAERANMAKLREQQLAAEAMAASEKAERKQCGKTK
jgi:cell division protein FtsB